MHDALAAIPRSGKVLEERFISARRGLNEATDSRQKPTPLGVTGYGFQIRRMECILLECSAANILSTIHVSPCSLFPSFLKRTEARSSSDRLICSMRRVCTALPQILACAVLFFVQPRVHLTEARAQGRLFCPSSKLGSGCFVFDILFLIRPVT